MKKIIISVVLCVSFVLPAYGQEAETMIVFKLTGDEASAEHLDLINAEIFMILDGSGKYSLINAEDLGEELMMSPTESLAFCNEEPGCIADIGAGKQAHWIVFGDVKKSFDGAKFIVHLVMVDVKARKVHGEKFGSFEKEGNVVLESGNTIRLLVGLPLPEPKPQTEPEVKKVADSDAKELKDIHKAPEKPKKKPKVIKKAAAPSKPGPFSNPWTLSAAGVGLASLTAGIILGVLSNQKVDDAKAAADQPAGMSLVHEGEDLATGANIAFILGGAALTGAVVLFILDVTGDEPAVTPAVACTGYGCTAGIHLTFW
jgi:hypothetical protein